MNIKRFVVFLIIFFQAFTLTTPISVTIKNLPNLYPPTSHSNIIAQTPVVSEIEMPKIAVVLVGINALNPSQPPSSHKSSNYPQLYTANLNGTELKMLTNMPITTFAWSPDGLKIAFVESEKSNIFLINSDGTGLKQITQFTESKTIESITWSPDGTIIFYDLYAGSDTTINKIDSISGVSWELLKGTDPQIFPGKSTLLFKIEGDLFTANLDGLNLQCLTCNHKKTRVAYARWWWDMVLYLDEDGFVLTTDNTSLTQPLNSVIPIDTKGTCLSPLKEPNTRKIMSISMDGKEINLIDIDSKQITEINSSWNLQHLIIEDCEIQP